MYHASAKQMKKLDRLAVQNGLSILQMMELAGWQMLNLFRLVQIPKRAKTLVLCGKGNNGGDGLAAARHLINYGYDVKVILAVANLNEHAGHQLKLLRKMQVPIMLFSKTRNRAKQEIHQANVVIDALIGYNLSGPPRGEFAALITLANQSQAKIIAYDLPSGADAEKKCFVPCVRADYSLTLALPKKAFQNPNTKKNAGKVFVADLGIPARIYDKVAQNSRPPFGDYRFGLIPLKS